MKSWLWKGMLAAAIALPALSAAARADDFGCSNASLRGRYGLATHGDFVGVYGTETPPVIHFYTGPSGDRAHTPFLPPEASAGVDCSKGCDVAIQLYADGERQ